jgi:hypothetical protein
MEERTMSSPNFTVAFSVDESPEEAFNAIKNIRGWWSEEIEGSTDKVGDEFTYHYKNIHRCTMRLTEAVPGKKVVWHVLDAHLSFVKDEDEWKGTDIVFEIAKKGDRTEVRFMHLGLIPEYECFDVCSNAWGSYINGSLRTLIATGAGRPNPKE